MHNAKEWMRRASLISNDPETIKQIVEMCYECYLAGMENGKNISTQQWHHTMSEVEV